MKKTSTILCILGAICLPASAQVDRTPMDAAGFYPGGSSISFAYDKSAKEKWLSENAAEIQILRDKVDADRRNPNGAKCLASSLEACISALSQTLAVANDGIGDSDIFAKPKTDVNGKAMGLTWRTVEAFLPSNRSTATDLRRKMHINIDLNADQTVKAVSSTLLHGTLAAQTEEDYLQTGAFEIVKAITASACPNQKAIDVARFIENQVKPLLRLAPNPPA